MAGNADQGGREATDDGGYSIAALVNRAGVGVVELSSTGAFRTVNEAFAELTGYSPSQLEGKPVSMVFPQEDVASIISTLLDQEQPENTPAVSTVVPLQPRDTAVLPCELHLEPLGTNTGDLRFVGVVRRVSIDANPQQSPPDSGWARSFLALAEAIPDGIIVLDTNSDILYANPAVESVLGHAPEELVGGSKLNIIPPRLRETHLAALNRYLDTGERHINWSYVELPGQHVDGHEVPLGISLNDFTIDGDRYFVGLFRDITAQKEAEAEAITRLAQQEAIANLGRHALVTPTIERLLDDATNLIAEMLDASVSSILELDTDTGTLDLRAAHGVPEEHVERTSIHAAANDNPAGYTLRTQVPLVVTDFETETRFDVPEAMIQLGIQSGISAIIGSPDDPWGVLNVYDTEPREFAEQAVHVVESVANILAAAIDRHERTQQIESQRAQLDAITHVYRVVQDIQQAIIRQSSQEEVEQTVCNRLADMNLIELAWIGHIDFPDRTLTPSTVAGEDSGYLDEITISLSEEEPGNRLAGEAIATQKTQLVSDVTTDDRFAPWRTAALKRGFHSLVVVPITYEQRVFGILGVYASTPDAFGPEVQTVFDTLGELLGHALTALSQREALHADRVTQVELRMTGALATTHPNPFEGHRLAFDGMLPVGDGRFLMYGSTTIPIDELDSLEALDIVDSATVLSEGDTEHRIEIQWRNPPISSLIASHGGRIKNGLLEDDTVVVTVELPATVDVTSVVEQIESQQPDLDIILQQRLTRDRGTTTTSDPSSLLDPLTDRQLNALETAYLSGYFEWPRTSSGGDIADALGITNPTFSQHLRGAQQKIFARLFATDDD